MTIMEETELVIPKKYRRFEHPTLTQEIKDRVTEQMDEDISIYDNSGIYKQLEDEFKDKFNVEYTISTNSGTSALISMFFGASIGKGDEVIVPAYTFFATATPLIQLGAIPILTDCDESGNISPEEIEKNITQKTKAVVITHMWGIPGQMNKIKSICKKHNLFLLEDVSHAHGARYDGKVLGSFSDGAAWSFQGKKILSAGEGGFFATPHKKFLERASLLGHFNKRAKKEVSSPDLEKFTITGLGLNLRMHPLGAAIALKMFEDFDIMLEEKREVASYINKRIEGIQGLEVPPIPERAKPAWYAFPFLFNHKKFKVSKKKFVEEINSQGGEEVDIPGSTCPINAYPIFYKPQEIFPKYSEYVERLEHNKQNFENADRFHSRVIKIPVWYGEERFEYAKHYMDLIEETARRNLK